MPSLTALPNTDVNPLTRLPGLWKSDYLTFVTALRIVRERLEKHYKARDITVREILVLIAANDGPHSQTIIAETMGLNRNVMVDLVDAMEKKGFVKRERKPENRREHILRVTHKGHAVLDWTWKNFSRGLVEAYHPVPADAIEVALKWAAAIINSHFDGTQRTRGAEVTTRKRTSA